MEGVFQTSLFLQEDQDLPLWKQREKLGKQRVNGTFGLYHEFVNITDIFFLCEQKHLDIHGIPLILPLHMYPWFVRESICHKKTS